MSVNGVVAVRSPTRENSNARRSLYRRTRVATQAAYHARTMRTWKKMENLCDQIDQQRSKRAILTCTPELDRNASIKLKHSRRRFVRDVGRKLVPSLEFAKRRSGRSRSMRNEEAADDPLLSA